MFNGHSVGEEGGPIGPRLELPRSEPGRPGRVLIPKYTPQLPCRSAGSPLEPVNIARPATSSHPSRETNMLKDKVMIFLICLIVAMSALVTAPADAQVATASSAATSVEPSSTEPSPNSTTASGQATSAAKKSDVLEEIVVTAQIRSESAQNIPLAITALGSDELEKRGITSVGDLVTGAIPTLKVSQVAGSPTVLEVAIRGFVNPNGTDITTENPVPFYIDGVYFGREQGSALDLTEIDSLTVLRGPQGTLFGKNAMGGAVQINSKEPTGEFGLRQTVEGGNLGYWKSITHLDLPRIGDLAAKLDFLATDNNGWQTNPSGPAANGNLPYNPTGTSTVQEENFGRVKATGGQLTLRYQPTDTFSVDFATDLTQAGSTNVISQVLSSSDLYTPSVWPNQTSRVDASQYPIFRPLDNQEYYGQRLSANWRVSDEFTVKSITAFRHDSSLEYNTPEPANTLPGVFVGRPDLGVVTAPAVVYDIHHKQISQEFQFIGTERELRWVGGLFFMNERGSQIDNTYFSLAFPNAVLGASPVPGLPGIASLGRATTLDPAFYLPSQITGADVKNTSAAAFGQATWSPAAFDSKLALTAGVRLGMDKKTVTRPFGFVWDSVTYAATQGASPPTPPNVPGQVCPCAPASITERRALPLFIAAYDWTENQKTYLSYSTGYRPATYSLSSQTLNPARADSAATVELGSKTEFFDHRARINLAAFRVLWKHPQENASTTAANTVEFFNGPTVTIEGFELDSSFAPMEGLVISIAGAYNNGKQPTLVSPFAPPGGAPEQQFVHIVDLPRLSGTVSVLYDVWKADYGTWRLNLDANGTSHYFSNPGISNENPGYGLLNARFGLAGMRFGENGGSLDLMLFGKNLLDRSYQVYDYHTLGVTGENSVAVFGQRATYGVSLLYKY
jgi:iron complex outermembrane receptor protein